MISLADLVRRKSLPAGVRNRCLVPTSGATSVSLWDADSAEALQAWLDATIDVDCSHAVHAVQEDFVMGLAELTATRAAERAAARAAGAAADLDAKLQVSARAAAAADMAGAVAAGAAAAARRAGARALEDERVARAATAVGAGLGASWRWAKDKANAAAVAARTGGTGALARGDGEVVEGEGGST